MDEYIENSINQDDIEIFQDDIEIYISLFCEKYNITDLEKETQNRWNYLLKYLYNNLFRGTYKLKYNPNINNEYNKEYIYNIILPMYIDLCNLYSKEICISGFSKFTGIELFTLGYWREEEPSSKGYLIIQKLILENEQSNSDLLTTIKNPVGVMARLNHNHAWNMPGVRTEQPKEEKADLLPNFGEPITIETSS